MAGQALLVVRFPAPVNFQGKPYRFLLVYGDKAHIRDIAATVRFEVPNAVQVVVFAVAMQFRTSTDDVLLMRWERQDWSNGCLSIPMRASCTEAIVPGYRIIVRLRGQEYEYRSNLEGSTFLLAAGPEHGITAPALRWEGSDGGCQTLLLGVDGRAATGLCGAPLTPLGLADDVGRPQQLADLVARFAPFEADTINGKVAFEGAGQEPALPAWKRAIAAWARLVSRELRAGRSGASWGLALAWSQPIPDKAGYCQFLQVDFYGYAYASTARCGGGDAADLGRGWLTTAEVEHLDTLYYGKAQVDENGLLLSGLGTEAMTSDEVDALWNWAEALYNHLAEQ
jgi:hypothetical protein